MALEERNVAIAPGELARLFSLEHPDPHSILGAHPGPLGVVIRLYRPGAASAVLIPEGGQAAEMALRDPAGLFEIALADFPAPFRYRFTVRYPDGSSTAFDDPYRFLPTVSDYDLFLWGEGTHEKAYEKLGAHLCEIDAVSGVSFSVWAPNAAGVSVVGDFNRWDGRIHMMRQLGSSGVWELFVPGLGPGERYKYEIHCAGGGLVLKADPFAQSTEVPPATASVVFKSSYSFRDDEWMEQRAARDLLKLPLSIYEVHLGSWRRPGGAENRRLSYRELAPRLADYLEEMGFTHVELLPVMEHPFEGSWGYQVVNYFAPTSRWGTPDDFRFFVDYLHQRGFGVILDWVPAHFPRDAFALGRFDGTALYEHVDSRRGEHPEWGTYIFNYGRKEVSGFLLASALNWLREFHCDGLRVDAVASMLYLDYARAEGQWLANPHGGRENLEAIAFLRLVNQRAYVSNPGIMMVAEESTAWPAVSRPPEVGGLGFGFKWDLGWMHDTLDYFSRDPVHRRHHHRDLTFGFLYAWSENYILPLSHDEVVHGKRSLLAKMAGDRWQQFANLRALYGYMWARPGKKLLFMGGEFGQWNEWNHNESLDWHLLAEPDHRGLKLLVRDLNHIYRHEPALWEADRDPGGFRWILADLADDNVIAFVRFAQSGGREIICVGNFSPVVRSNFRIGVPRPGLYRELLNTDAAVYGGGNVGNEGAVPAEATPCHGFSYSVPLTLPPLAVLWLAAPG